MKAQPGTATTRPSPTAHHSASHLHSQPMSSVAFARIARARLSCSSTTSPSAYRLRPTTRVQSVQPVWAASFSTRPSALRMPEGDAHDPHHEESFEEFTARYGSRTHTHIHPPGGRTEPMARAGDTRHPLQPAHAAAERGIMSVLTIHVSPDTKKNSTKSKTSSSCSATSTTPSPTTSCPAPPSSLPP